MVCLFASFNGNLVPIIFMSNNSFILHGQCWKIVDCAQLFGHFVAAISATIPFSIWLVGHVLCGVYT